MLKIIQVNASYKPAFIYGGPTMSVSKLSEVLVSKNLDLEVLTTRANGKEELNVTLNQTILVENVPVTYYKRLTKDHTHFSPGLYWGLIRKLGRKNKGERKKCGGNSESDGKILVHIHTWWNLVSVISCLIAVLKGIPVVLSPRGTLSTYSFGNRNNIIKSLIHSFISKPLLKRCHMHATSEHEKKALLALLKPKSIRVIPNLVSLPEYKQQEARDKKKERKVETQDSGSKKQEGVFNLLFLSRIEEKKGLELLFSAIAGIRLNFHLSIAGSGDEAYVNQLKKLSTSLGIDDKISWMGHQSADKKFDIMEEHDLLVLPSYNENFANVVIESLASGTAVVITENVGLSDYVSTNDLGWVCKLDVDLLKGSLLEAVADKEKLERIRDKAPAKIREDFSDDVVAEQYIKMYKKVLYGGVPGQALSN